MSNRQLFGIYWCAHKYVFIFYSDMHLDYAMLILGVCVCGERERAGERPKVGQEVDTVRFYYTRVKIFKCRPVSACL